MKYEDIKKMGEAYAQIQEKQRQENAKRAEAMLKQEAKKLADQKEAMGDSKDDNDQIAQRKALQAKKKDEGAMKRGSALDTYKKKPDDAKEGAKQGKSIKGTIQKPIKADASNDKSDDGDGMDKVDKKAVKKKFDDRKDKDIDNDGDVDSSDEYLHKRRKAISKNSESKGKKEVEVQTQEKVKEAASTGAGKNSDNPSSPSDDGLAPNAKKELDRAVKEPGVDAEKSNKLNFASFKKMTKKSKDN